MKRLPIFMASLLLLSAPSFAQKVKLAKVALGMSETEVKDALDSSSPHYINQPSANPELHLLIAETADESLGFTFIYGHVAAFSLMHVLSAGQQPFLKPGQEPSVKVLRDLVIAQTWKPATIEAGDTFWASNASGAALSDPSQCAPKSSPAWTSIGDVPGATAKLQLPDEALAGAVLPALRRNNSLE